MKKVLSIVSCLVLLPIFICLIFPTACSPRKKDTNTISVWHWMTDRQEAFEELAAKYKEQTGINVKVDLYAPSDAYTQRIVASAQAKVLPDVYGILDTKEIFASFIQNGFVANLTEEFAANNGEWEKALYEKALDVNRFYPDNAFGVAPGIYGVPLDVTNIQMVYNKKLLKKAGIQKVPQTFDEFLVAVKALKRVGVESFVSGWGELWMADCFASNYAFNLMGKDKVMATFRGEIAYTDPDWISVFNVFKTLRDSGAFFPGLVTKPNKDAEQDFALERAAFSFNGSWCVNVYHQMNPDLEYGVMLPPAINPVRPMSIWGGAGGSFVVNGSSPNRDKAIAFLKWLTAQEQQIYLAEKTRNLPSNRFASPGITEILGDFAKGSDFTTHPTIWEHNELPLVTETFTKGLQSIIIGEKTPEQVGKEVQAVKEREMKKNASR